MNKHFDEKDPRFQFAHREALIGVFLVIVNFLWWFCFAYILGSKPVEEYTYIFGLPAWFFYSCVVGAILMTLLVYVVVKLFFKDVPLEDKEGE